MNRTRNFSLHSVTRHFHFAYTTGDRSMRDERRFRSSCHRGAAWNAVKCQAQPAKWYPRTVRNVRGRLVPKESNVAAEVDFAEESYIRIFIVGFASDIGDLRPTPWAGAPWLRRLPVSKVSSLVIPCRAVCNYRSINPRDSRLSARVALEALIIQQFRANNRENLLAIKEGSW